MVPATQAEVVDSMEPIAPIAPPTRLPPQAEPAQTDVARRRQPGEPGAERRDEADSQTAFLTHLGLPVAPPGPTARRAAPAPGIPPASATAVAATATFVDDANGAPMAQAASPGEAITAFAASPTILPASTLPASAPVAPDPAPARGLPPTAGSGIAPDAASFALAVPSPAAATSPYPATDPAQAPVRQAAIPGGKPDDADPHGSAGQPPRPDVAVTLRYPAPSSPYPVTDPAQAPVKQAAIPGGNPDAADPQGSAGQPPRPDVSFTLRIPVPSSATEGGSLPTAGSAVAVQAPDRARALPGVADATDAAAPVANPPVRAALPSRPASSLPIKVSDPASSKAAEQSAEPATSGSVPDRTGTQTIRDVDRAMIPAQTIPSATEAPAGVASDPPAGDGHAIDFASVIGTPLGAASDDTHGPGRATATAGERVVSGPPLPAGFGQHLADVAARFPDRPVELTLSPEELGRVRMTFTTGDGALTMTLVADRPETLDLLRRHIDVLAQDFRDLGFANLSFSFAQGDDSPPPETVAAADTDAPAAAAPASARDPATRPSARSSDGGLDLRL